MGLRRLKTGRRRPTGANKRQGRFSQPNIGYVLPMGIMNRLRSNLVRPDSRHVMRVEIGAMVAKEAITDRQSADHTQRFQRLRSYLTAERQRDRSLLCAYLSLVSRPVVVSGLCNVFAVFQSLLKYLYFSFPVYRFIVLGLFNLL